VTPSELNLTENVTPSELQHGHAGPGGGALE
jgi:hypothetical protein